MKYMLLLSLFQTSTYRWSATHTRWQPRAGSLPWYRPQWRRTTRKPRSSQPLIYWVLSSKSNFFKLFSINHLLIITIISRFLTVSDFYCPKEDGKDSQVFISKSYDATTHFETTCLDVLDVYRRGTGEDFDFSKVRHDLGDEEQ